MQEQNSGDMFEAIQHLLNDAREVAKRPLGADVDWDGSPTQLYIDAIRRDYGDDVLWNDVTSREDSATDAAARSDEARFDTARELYRDVFSSLYKGRPETRPAQSMRPSHRLNHRLVEEMMKTEEWRDLRSLTALDALQSAYACRNLTRRLISGLGRDAVDAVNAASRSEVAEGSAEADLGDVAAQGQAALEEGDLESAGAAAQQCAEMIKELADLAEQSLSANAELAGKLDSAGEAARMAMRAALRDLKEDVEQQKGAHLMLGASGGDGWGGGMGGVGEGLPLADKVAMARSIQSNARLLALAKRAGRYRIMAHAQMRKKVPNSRDEIKGSTVGRDLALMLPSERVRLATPALRRSFYKDYAEGKLAVATFSGKAKVGEGPVVLCIDDSGSMGGLPEQCAKAVMLAIISVCRAKKRDVSVCLFNTQVAASERFKKGGTATDWQKLAELATYHRGGGTLYEPWLDFATAEVTGHAMNAADVIVITDGLCAVMQPTVASWAALRKARAFSCIGVLIGSPPAGILHDLCDTVHVLPAAAEWPDDVLNELFDV